MWWCQQGRDGKDLVRLQHLSLYSTLDCVHNICCSSGVSLLGEERCVWSYLLSGRHYLKMTRFTVPHHTHLTANINFLSVCSIRGSVRQKNPFYTTKKIIINCQIKKTLYVYPCILPFCKGIHWTGDKTLTSFQCNNTTRAPRALKQCASQLCFCLIEEASGSQVAAVNWLNIKFLSTWPWKKWAVIFWILIHLSMLWLVNVFHTFSKSAYVISGQVVET